MEKKHDNLPEAQSAKKANNKSTFIVILIAALSLICSSGDGAIPMLAGIAGIIIAIVYFVKMFKGRKK